MKKTEGRKYLDEKDMRIDGKVEKGSITGKYGLSECSFYFYYKTVST